MQAYKTISIVSCAREPSYLADTLRSIEEPGIEVEIFYQSKDGGQDIPALRQEYNCAIPRVYLTEKMYDEVQLNGQYNYAETLLNTKDGLILEDDVQVSKKFMQYLREVEKLIPDEKSIVTLYSIKKWNDSNKFELIKLASSHFRHTQAMLYPVPVARAFGQHILDHFGAEPYDNALRTFCRLHGTKIYAVNYSLVQHIGKVTTGLGYHHQSRNFADDFLS
ncbi:MAG: hypothetical protein KatS3mg031_1327 [Chitinophagales bacterium]|nr:MAG: hypothetical protein KatS3mg031_1327 [Chitinophagales bacterium]